MNNEYYWAKKDDLATIAKTHTEEMQKRYNVEINNCVNKSKIYGPDFIFSKKEKGTNKLIMENLDSVSAVLKYKNENCCVLNFASYKYPGGAFILGSRAQEECLCHESFLYNVLSSKENENYYNWNKKNLNRALYMNRAIFTPNVKFIRKNDETDCSVITCAAPNASTAYAYKMVSENENLEALTSRIKFILDIANENNIKTLITGAFGCGVFGQDALEVAKIFKNLIKNNNYCFDNIIFAVIDNKDKNYEKMKSVIETY